MNSYTYWPYDEVSLERQVADKKIKLKTPWLEAICPEFFDDDKLTILSTKIADKNLTVNDLGLVNDFFSHFHQYPIAYILPTAKDGILDKHALVDPIFLDGDLEDVLRKIFDHEKNFGAPARVEILSVLERNNWAWDTGAALDFATYNDTIHPESIFSIARRYHLLEVINSDKGIKIFQEIKKLSKDQFKIAVAKLIRQNHFVTQKCHGSLAPAIDSAQRASSLVQEFMKEEKGHDKIIGKALMHLGELPENIAVSVQTRALMHVLKVMAQRNFLAFSMAIDAFERSNFDNADPLAQLLIDGGFHHAAKFLNLHMNINNDGNHHNVAKKFLQFMDFCDRDYALEAMRWMEIVSLLMSAISQSACLENFN